MRFSSGFFPHYNNFIINIYIYLYILEVCIHMFIDALFLGEIPKMRFLAQENRWYSLDTNMSWYSLNPGVEVITTTNTYFLLLLCGTTWESYSNTKRQWFTEFRGNLSVQNTLHVLGDRSPQLNWWKELPTGVHQPRCNSNFLGPSWPHSLSRPNS